MTINTCPICESKGECICTLTSEYIRKQLESYFGMAIPNDLIIENYDILKCTKCSLEYADPMLPGTSKYYSWITQQTNYYPNIRWEWQVVLDMVKNNVSSNTSILEIGCGTGDFIEKANSINNLNVVGIDLTAKSVEICRNKGLITYCETLEAFIANSEHKIKDFDYIVAFHTLEHITDPKAFISSLSTLLKPNGCIFLSTPYSPMSFETMWFDPLNHPPHHLTRWDITSYKELACQLRMDINLHMPDAANICSRVFTSLNLHFNGTSPLSPQRVFIQALFSPYIALTEVINQLRRMKVKNKIAANVVLVELFNLGA